MLTRRVSVHLDRAALESKLEALQLSQRPPPLTPHPHERTQSSLIPYPTWTYTGGWEERPSHEVTGRHKGLYTGDLDQTS